MKVNFSDFPGFECGKRKLGSSLIILNLKQKVLKNTVDFVPLQVDLRNPVLIKF